jgi:uncharacterized protein (TIGR00369 family)
MTAGAQLMHDFLPASPFARAAGVRLEAIEADRARLALPFTETVVTIGDLVHGGAISTLADCAAMAAAWSAVDVVGDPPRGTTVGLSIDFLAAARGHDLLADARVLRRGGSLCFCDVEVRAGDTLVAKALVTYKLG